MEDQSKQSLPSRYDAAKVKLPPYFVDTEQTRKDMVSYLAEITYYDDQVGQIVKLLDKHGLADNTLVVCYLQARL